MIYVAGVGPELLDTVLPNAMAIVPMKKLWATAIGRNFVALSAAKALAVMRQSCRNFNLSWSDISS